MTRYKNLFNRLASNKEGAFVPFVMLGDPNAELSLQIIDTIIDSGADALELGVPFSDPVADGPVIQRAALRALAACITPTKCFALLAEIRQKHPKIPIGLLMYANLVFHNGIDVFYQQCADAGVDSVLIVDVPFEESAPFRTSALQHSIAPIFICPPNANNDLLHKIASHGRSYTYLLSRTGVTGNETKIQVSCHPLINKLREYHAPPPLQGFGISNSAQVKSALLAGAIGVISGSAVVQIIEQNQDNVINMMDALVNFVSLMKIATQL